MLAIRDFITLVIDQIILQHTNNITLKIYIIHTLILACWPRNDTDAKRRIIKQHDGTFAHICDYSIETKATLLKRYNTNTYYLPTWNFFRKFVPVFPCIVAISNLVCYKRHQSLCIYNVAW